MWERSYMLKLHGSEDEVMWDQSDLLEARVGKNLLEAHVGKNLLEAHVGKKLHVEVAWE